MVFPISRHRVAKIGNSGSPLVLVSTIFWSRPGLAVLPDAVALPTFGILYGKLQTVDVDVFIRIVTCLLLGLRWFGIDILGISATTCRKAGYLVFFVCVWFFCYWPWNMFIIGVSIPHTSKNLLKK
jgi:hypothetical protein